MGSVYHLVYLMVNLVFKVSISLQHSFGLRVEGRDSRGSPWDLCHPLGIPGLDI